MDVYKGIAVSPGVVIGEAVVLDAEDYRIPYRSVEPTRLPDELDSFARSVSAAIDEFTLQQERLQGELGRDAAEVFNWHISVLADERLRREITLLIENRHYSAAYATSTVMRNQQRRFLQMTNPLLADRIRDVQDIERRLLRHILGDAREDLAHLTKPAILIAHDLTASQTANITGTMVTGVALDAGGPTSHSAILLRSLARPAVIGVRDISTQVSGGDLVIIDAANSLVIVNPDAHTLESYQARQETYIRHSGQLEEYRELEAVTEDGHRVYLFANIEFPGEAKVATEKGADGIGLYRTEYLFLRREGEPTEEEQYESYREAIESAEGRPVTIRTFDLGADKYTQERQYDQERNPMLGLRSIRYSLQHLDLFKKQLRAILRASTLGNVRLMFPLIVSLMEFRQAKMTLHDAMEDLEDEKKSFGRDVLVGIMVETPAAAIQAKEFAREVDFMSIGTNDLTQFVLAVDRGNERVSRFCNCAHPAVLRMIRDVIRTCQRTGVDCSLCGEMAGEPLYMMLLLGLGLRSFSMAPHMIPEIKKLARSVKISQAERIAKRALTFETDRQVTNYLRDKMKHILPDGYGLD
jgi:phosphotransferase system enzyme I (PtsI)